MRYSMELNFASEDAKLSFMSRVETTKARLTLEPWAHLWMRLYQLSEAPLRSHLEAARCSIPRGAKWAF